MIMMIKRNNKGRVAWIQH